MPGTKKRSLVGPGSLSLPQATCKKFRKKKVNCRCERLFFFSPWVTELERAPFTRVVHRAPTQGLRQHHYSREVSETAQLQSCSLRSRLLLWFLPALGRGTMRVCEETALPTTAIRNTTMLSTTFLLLLGQTLAVIVMVLYWLILLVESRLV